MKTRVFKQEYWKWITSDEGEHEFAALRLFCSGLSSQKMGKLINRTVSLAEGDEIYCEIGTFLGYTLISASLHNSKTNCLGIDGFQFFENEEKRNTARERFKTNLTYFYGPNLRFIESDYRLVNLGEDVKIGVFYVDGEHTREEARKCLEWGHKRMADNAIVFIDDICSCDVYGGVQDFLKDHDEYREIFHMDVDYPDHIPAGSAFSNVFWNGLSILEFNRKKSG